MSRLLTKRLFCKFSKQIVNHRRNVRTLLSDAYYCRDRWNSRLQSAVLQKIDAEEFAVKLQDKYDREGSMGAIDIDILTNKFEQIPQKQLDFAQSLLYKFRHTNESLDMLDSTPCALVRALIHLKKYDRLWEIVNDKVNYGIFLDYYSASMLMDYFIKKQMHHEAAHVAYDLMLQEDFDHPLCRALSWYACHLRWRNPPTEESPEAEVEPEAEDEEDEKIVKVNFITNPWYDDHFDILKEMWLLGKTLSMITREDESLMGRSYRLIGWGMYEKFDKGVELMKKWAESNEQQAVCQEALNDFEHRLKNVKTQEPPTEVKPPGVISVQDLIPYITEQQKTEYMEQFKVEAVKLQSSGKVVESFDLDTELLKYVESTVHETETADIKQQEVLFDTWNVQRQELVEEQIQEYKRSLHKESLKKRLEELREREIKLTYFDNKARIDMMRRRGEKLKELEELFQTEEYLHWAPRT